jgi:plastocyanin
MTVANNDEEGALQIRSVAITIAAVAVAAAGCGGSSGSGSSSTGASSSAAEHPSELLGDVGHNDAFTMSLKDPQGNPIKDLAAGTYQVVINDESQIHNFHIKGSGVDDATSVPAVGMKTYTETFTAGTYSFLCDAHPDTMKGSFKVS